MLNSFLEWINSFFTVDKKELVKSRIEEYEKEKQSKGEWIVNLTLITEILELVDDDIIRDVSLSTLNEIKLVTGFKNVKHLLDWVTSVNRQIRSNNLPLDPELLYIYSDRKNISLFDFLIVNKSIFIDLIGLKKWIITNCKSLEIDIETIPDVRDKHRLKANISSIYRDLFAVSEALIKAGLSNE